MKLTLLPVSQELVAAVGAHDLVEKGAEHHRARKSIDEVLVLHVAPRCSTRSESGIPSGLGRVSVILRGCEMAGRA